MRYDYSATEIYIKTAIRLLSYLHFFQVNSWIGIDCRRMQSAILGDGKIWMLEWILASTVESSTSTTVTAGPGYGVWSSKFTPHPVFVWSVSSCWCYSCLNIRLSYISVWWSTATCLLVSLIHRIIPIASQRIRTCDYGFIWSDDHGLMIVSK